MKRFCTAGALTLAALVAGCGVTSEAFTSGPQVGASPGIFDPLHVTGPAAGEKACLI